MVFLAHELIAQEADLTCEFDQYDYNSSSWLLYRCKGTFSNISKKDTIATYNEESSNHLPHKSNSYVEAISVEYQKHVEYFPQGLEEIFPNLGSISFDHSGLKEICQKDLKPFYKLKVASFTGNLIEFLDRDLFLFNSDLIEVRFSSNKISYICPNIFKHLSSLKTLYMNGNLCIDELAFGEEKVKILIQKIKINCSFKGAERYLNIKNEELNGRVIELSGQMKSVQESFKTYKNTSIFVIASLAVFLLLITIVGAILFIKFYRRDEQTGSS